MTNSNLLGSWVRRFLLEYLVKDRNLSVNTQSSYRDMLLLLLTYANADLGKPVDRLEVNDLSPKLVRQFLIHIEQNRRCSAVTRNQRLGGLHALARFIGENSPDHLEWCTQIRLIPFKKVIHPTITYLNRAEMNAILAAPNPEKSVLSKAFLAKKTGKACPCWLYVIYQQKYNQASGDLSGEQDKQQSEQAQH